MCIPNYTTTHLSCQNIIYVKQIPDIPVPKKEHVPFGKVNLIVCNYQIVNYKFSTPLTMVGKVIFVNTSHIPGSLIMGPGQPPDRKIIYS